MAEEYFTELEVTKLEGVRLREYVAQLRQYAKEAEDRMDYLEDMRADALEMVTTSQDARQRTLNAWEANVRAMAKMQKGKK